MLPPHVDSETKGGRGFTAKQTLENAEPELRPIQTVTEDIQPSTHKEENKLRKWGTTKKGCAVHVEYARANIEPGVTVRNFMGN